MFPYTSSPARSWLSLTALGSLSHMGHMSRRWLLMFSGACQCAGRQLLEIMCVCAV